MLFNDHETLDETSIAGAKSPTRALRQLFTATATCPGESRPLTLPAWSVPTNQKAAGHRRYAFVCAAALRQLAASSNQKLSRRETL